MAEYNKQYTPTLWKDYPLTDTSINAYRLNHLEGGVNENDNRLVALSEDKAEQAVVNKMVKTVTLNKDTGVLTVTLLDGTQSTYDLDVEKVVANFDLNNNNDLVLTLADGTQKVVPLSKFVDTYTFKSSGTITFNANGKEITAFIPDGGITLAKLEATVLSTIRQYMLDAQTAKGQAEQAAENARGYAVGGAGFEGVSAQHFANQAKRYAVITDEAPRDNAQYYAQDAAKSAEEARQAAGCDGTAASISAVDVQGLVAAAGGTSDVQALINAVADQVINRLVAKGQIVNNLLATEPGNVLDATQGKALKEYYDRLNSDLGDFKFYKSLDEIGITGTDFTHQAFVDLMPVNSLLLSFVTGLSFLPNISSYILFVRCTGSSSSKRITFEATEAFGSARGVYKARYAAPAGTQWSGWDRDLTNADIDGRLFFSASGTTAIESFDNASNRYRLQVGTAGTVRLYHSSDGGKTWANFKEIAFTS